MRVELINAGFSSDERSVFRGVNLSISPGEVLAVTSKEPAGKSLLFRIISLKQPLEMGDILIDGKDPDENRKIRSHYLSSLGIVSDAIYYFDGTDLSSLVDLNYYLATGISRREYFRRVEEAMNLLEVGDYEDRRLGDLSRSERGRFLFALELVRNPTIYLFDSLLEEVGDYWGERIFLIIRKIGGDGRAAVFFERRLPAYLERRTSKTVVKEGEFTVYTLFRKDDSVI